MTAQSSKYACVTETTTTTPVATRPSPGIPKNANSPSQTLPAYVWIRCATGAEGPILDAGFGHPAPDGGYHYHANPRALRYQLNDNLIYQAGSDTYSENTANLHHSPIPGWAYDGYPIYGPYGYSIASDAASPVRRMVSGHVPRDTANHTRYGVADLSDPVTKRHSLAPWAALFHTFTTALGTTDHPLSSATYGPDVSVAFPVGWYAGDFDYLGDRFKPGTTSKFQQGTDYDLDKPNGRFCVTPEFPGGTYAYFIPIDANGAPAFPFSIGRYWYGNRTGGRVIIGNITEAVTTWLTAGPAAVETWAHAPTLSPESGNITLTWNSLEGTTYKIEATDALGTWLTAGPAAANSSTTAFTTPSSPGRRFYQVKRTGNAPFDPAYTGQ